MRSDGVQCTVLDYCLPTRRRHYMARPSNSSTTQHTAQLCFSYEMDPFLYELMPVQCWCCVWEAVAETPQSMFSQSSSQVRQLIIGPTAGAEERASKYFWATEIFFCLHCRRPLVSGGVGSQHRTLRAAAVSRGALTSAIMGR